jgi:hypothetical protein
MNTNPETDLDLEKLFLPAWAQEPASVNRYAKYSGGEDKPDRRRDDRRGPRPPRREGDRRDSGRAQGGDRPRPPRGDGGGRKFSGDDRGAFRRGDRPDRRDAPPPAPPPEIELSLVPDDKGVESLARQIKITGRAYPLFQIAQLILAKPERYVVRFAVKKGPDGKPVQPLFVCALDDSLWLSEDEAIGNVLKHHFTTFYQAERTPTEPPKGKYTFVAQCGLSGVILGPPNYHDYQNHLRKLHAARFANMPFEVYKSRVKIVRDEEVVKKWIDEQSWKTEYICLNLPEPLKLGSLEETQRHFREVHKDTIVKPVETHTLTGVASRTMRCAGLARLVRSVWEDNRRFPLQIATVLSQQFASHGLQFFKVNRTLTHVSVARPHYLDLEATPVSDGIRRIVDFINTKPKCTRRQLVETLAPSPAPTVVTMPAAPAPAAIAPAVAATEGEPIAATVPAVEAAPATDAAPATEAAPPPAESAEPTPEQTAVIADLHWLIHQGHVIEFASGVLDTAKKPAPKPVKPAAIPAASAVAESAPVTDAGASVGAEAVETAGGETSVAAEPAGAPSVAVMPESQPAVDATAPDDTQSPVSETAPAIPDQAPTETPTAPIEPQS